MQDDLSNPFQSPPAVRSSADAVPLTVEQHAREQKLRKELRGTQNGLMLLGLIIIGFNAYFALNAETNARAYVERSIEKLNLPPDKSIDPSARQKMVEVQTRSTLIYDGLRAGMGLGQLLLGCAVLRFPLFATMSSLILYLVPNLLFWLISHQASTKFIGLFHILVLMSMYKGIRTAIAYRREIKNRENQWDAAATPMPQWLRP